MKIPDLQFVTSFIFSFFYKTQCSHQAPKRQNDYVNTKLRIKPRSPRGPKLRVKSNIRKGKQNCWIRKEANMRITRDISRRYRKISKVLIHLWVGLVLCGIVIGWSGLGDDSSVTERYFPSIFYLDDSHFPLFPPILRPD